MTTCIFDNFLSDEECIQFILDIEQKKHKIPFTDSSNAETDKYIDLELAIKFFERVKELDNENKVKTVRPNNLIMSSKYEPGTQFGLHTDTGLYYESKTGIKSKYTLLIYLNDDFTGGETIFYDNFFREIQKVVPKKGSAIVFEIENNFHRGALVENGNKYWIGCELIG